jgi:predicted anti-sigma-YlaC factor YlaD
MRCEQIREALSARLDGEAAEPEDAFLDAHLDTCPSCAAWSQDLTVLHRMVRVREAEAVPDLTTAILAAAPGAPTPRRAVARTEPVSVARWALFVVALSQLVLAAPALILGEGSGATVHAARELGAFDVALAVGLLLAVWQPARAWGLFPVVAALALVFGGTAVLDVVRGTASSLGEVHHLLDLAGVAVLWRVAHEAQGLPSRRRVATA